MTAYPQFLVLLGATVDPSMMRAMGLVEQMGTRGFGGIRRGADSAADSASRFFRGTAASSAAALGALNGLSSRFNAIGGLFERFSARTAGILALAGGTSGLLISTSDLQNQQALLRAVTGSQEAYTQALASSIRTAKEARTALGDTIKLTAKLQSANETLGLSQQQLTAISEVTLKAIRLSGAGVQEAQAATLQFAQFLGSGRSLGGDELKSISENAPRLARAIAQGLGVAQGALKDLGAEGQLTADKVIPALLKMSGTIDTEFANMPVTLDQATTAMKTSLASLVIRFEGATGIIAGTARGIQFLADNLSTVLVPAAAAAAVAMARLSATSIATAFFSTASAFLLVSNQAGVLAGSMATLRAASAGLLGVFGGPWGVALAAAAGGLAFMALRSSQAERAARTLTDAQAAQQKAIEDTNSVLYRMSGAYAAIADNAKRAADAQTIAAEGGVSRAASASRQVAARRLFNLGLSSGLGPEGAKQLRDQFAANRLTEEKAIAALSNAGKATAGRVDEIKSIFGDLNDSLSKLGLAAAGLGTAGGRQKGQGATFNTLTADEFFKIAKADEQRVKAQDSALKQARQRLASFDAQVKLSGKATQDDIQRRALLVEQVKAEEKALNSATEALSRSSRSRASSSSIINQNADAFEREARAAEELRRTLDKEFAINLDYERQLGDIKKYVDLFASSKGKAGFSPEVGANLQKEALRTQQQGLFDTFKAARTLRVSGTWRESISKETAAGIDSPEVDEARRDFARKLNDALGQVFRGNFRDAGNSFLDAIIGRSETLRRAERVLEDKSATPDEKKQAQALKEAVEKGSFGGIVRGMRQFNQVLEDALKDGIGGILDGLGLTGGLGESVGMALAGSRFGKSVTSALGIKGSTTGAGIGAGLGSLLGPQGAVIGSVIGSAIGGLFKKTPSASVTFGTDQFGGVGVSSTSSRGKGGAARLDAVRGNATGVIDTLSDIAQRLGGTLAAGVQIGSLGSRKDKFTFDPSGSGKTKGSGVLKFENAEDAARAAIESAIDKGIIQGLKAQTQRLLQSGGALEAAIDKAVSFENVFRRLRAYTDPVGLALEDLNREFENLKRLFDEAGASAEQYAQLEELYGKDRLKIIEEQGRASVSTLQSFLDEMRYGSESPLSLRDREANILPSFQKFVDDISSGKQVDQSAFVQTSQDLLNIRRELYGSTSSFFETFNQIQDLTNKAIAAFPNVTSIASGIGTPFDTKSVTSAIEQQTTSMAQDSARMISLLEQIAANGTTGTSYYSGADFASGLAAMRNF